MTVTWPRLPRSAASSIYADIVAGARPSPSAEHPGQIWAAVGDRADDTRIRDLMALMTACAAEHGHPGTASPSQRIAFDRAAAAVIRGQMDLTWAEAGTAEMWSFTSLVLLPDLTYWRFGANNPERWTASDLTRHTWSRLWWHAESFGDDDAVLALLGESDLNQILERRSVGGNPNVVRAFSRALVAFDMQDLPRRAVIRDVTKRLLRRLAYVDGSSLGVEQLTAMCHSLLQDSAQALRLDDSPSTGLVAPQTAATVTPRASWLRRLTR